MLGFIRNLKIKRKIRKSSQFVLEEVAGAIKETIDYFNGRIKEEGNKYEEILKVELTILAFWLFKVVSNFPRELKILIQDEIHTQYYDKLKKNGFDFKVRQLVCNDFNLHYKKYDELFKEDNDLTFVSIEFCNLLAKRVNTKTNLEDVKICLHLIGKLMPKFEKWRQVVS